MDKDELNSQIENEYAKINEINQIQDELNIMNRSLNNCVDIAYSSAINRKNINKYNEVKEELENGYKLANENLDSSLEQAKDTIHKLEEKRDKKED